MTRALSPKPGWRPGGPLLVAMGIAASRLAGLVRETVTARLLGNTAAADAFAVAMRIPNLLQNLFGEGVLSASFVPVYSRLIGRNETTTETTADHETSTEAGELAGAAAALLLTLTGVGVAVLVTLAEPITRVLAPGLGAQRFELAVSLTRITALGVGFAVMSAWCLGVLNSHRRFFLAYAAPVLWNAVQVAAVVTAAILAFDLDDLARALAWGVVGGGLAQMLVQLPLTVRLAKGLRLNWGRGSPDAQQVRRRFVPAVLGRGAVQVSAYVDLILASLLATGAVAALFRAQILYMLPISLFAMSVAAAELPEMSRLEADRRSLNARARSAVGSVAFWMPAVAAGYVAAGDMVVRLLFEGGEFSADDTVLVWLVVAAYGCALPAAGISRVLHSTCYATGDATGPARIAAIRVTVAAAVGTLVMFPLDRVTVIAGELVGTGEALGFAWALPAAQRELSDVVRLGAVGLAVGSAVAAWVELALLCRRVRGRVGGVGVASHLVRLIPATAAALIVALAAKAVAGDWPALLGTPVVAAACGVAYLGAARLCGVAEAGRVISMARSLAARGRL